MKTIAKKALKMSGLSNYSMRGITHIMKDSDYIDLRSDTVTRPTKKMKDAMYNAEVGDDVYNSDPTVNKLQSEVAALFGKEDALFVASGTMGNLVSLMTHIRQKGQAVIIGDKSHVYKIERGGLAAIGNIYPLSIKNHEDGTLDIDQIKTCI